MAKAKKTSRMNRTNMRNGLLFTLPALIGLAAFTLYPMAASLYYSFCRFTGLKPPVWIGTGNYAFMLHDRLLREALWNTVYYTVFAVPLGIITAFSLAVLLNAKVRGLAFFRTIFYLPSIVPVVASSVLWLWILNPENGLVNAVIEGFGKLLAAVGLPQISGPGWLADPHWSKPALILMSVWGVGAWIVIYLAGLQDVPQELYEAASLDGATSWQKTRHVTIPFMSPYIFFTAVMGVIGSLQYFTQAWVMTRGTGGPVNSTMMFSMYLFQNAFQFFKMGYACAMAWLLFVLIMAATLLIFKTSARYVYYGGR
ncbi:MAG: sugar ABC transporter permease [Armatimonadota bacterium]|nr:sugar ABC transporter permease [Armatimonadota bacterium]